jgi:acetyl-CoA carboxylase biotin carboxylase subunit
MVPPQYDAMVAKLIVHAPTRERAIERQRRALGELVIEGIKTNADEQMRIISTPKFRGGQFGTSFIEEFECQKTT